MHGKNQIIVYGDSDNYRTFAITSSHKNKSVSSFMDFLFENTGTLLDWCDALGEQAKTVTKKTPIKPYCMISNHCRMKRKVTLIQVFVLVLHLWN